MFSEFVKSLNKASNKYIKEARNREKMRGRGLRMCRIYPAHTHDRASHVHKW